MRSICSNTCIHLEIETDTQTHRYMDTQTDRQTYVKTLPALADGNNLPLMALSSRQAGVQVQAKSLFRKKTPNKE